MRKTKPEPVNPGVTTATVKRSANRWIVNIPGVSEDYIDLALYDAIDTNLRAHNKFKIAVSKGFGMSFCASLKHVNKKPSDVIIKLTKYNDDGKDSYFKDKMSFARIIIEQNIIFPNLNGNLPENIFIVLKIK